MSLKSIKVKTYRCTTCLKTYNSKIYFDRHTACCKVLSRTVKEKYQDTEREQDIPSIEQLYEIIKTLLVEQDKMKKEIEKLKKYADTKRKQIDVFEYLNKSIKPIQTYKEWVNNLKFTQDDLDILLEDSYSNAMNKYFENIFGNMNEEDLKIPIRAFTEKQNILYIYEFEEIETEDEIKRELKWIKLNEDNWKILMKHISKLVFDKFKEWQDENEDRFDDESFSLKYHMNVKKIMTNMGLPFTSLQKKIWNLIKLDFKNIVSYELE